MNRKRIHGWDWHLSETSALHPWLERYLLNGAESYVKNDSRRAVFRVETDVGPCYVKHDHPVGAIKAIKALAMPKCRSEYASAAALKAAGIPVVDVLGWGRRGVESMLLSRECAGASDARKVWLEMDVGGRPGYLSRLASFVKVFVASGARHPDFHLGNLLSVGKDGVDGFVLVDPYGVSFGGQADPERSGAWNLAAFFRAWLRMAEAAEFLDSACLAVGDAFDTWRRIVFAAAAESNRLWPKRAQKIFSRHSRFNLDVSGVAGSRWLSRRCPVDGAAMFDPAMPGMVESLPRGEGERLWAASWWLWFHQIRHREVVGLSRTADCDLVAWAPEPVVGDEVGRPGGIGEFRLLLEAAGAAVPRLEECLASDNFGVMLRHPGLAVLPPSFAVFQRRG